MPNLTSLRTTPSAQSRPPTRPSHQPIRFRVILNRRILPSSPARMPDSFPARQGNGIFPANVGDEGQAMKKLLRWWWVAVVAAVVLTSISAYSAIPHGSDWTSEFEWRPSWSFGIYEYADMNGGIMQIVRCRTIGPITITSCYCGQPLPGYLDDTDTTRRSRVLDR